MLSVSEIRDKYISFFKNREHTHLPSSSLVPYNDPSVLLTTAGMLQFKPIMFGLESPKYKRATTHQKCFRTTDLDNVGRTPRHHTFFEMLGNFSFGDYYKKEAIAFAWEFLTKEMAIPEEKLSVTVHYDDQEAYDIWHRVMGLPEEKIVRLGDKDNFWAAGETGPCGPCSEIYYDQGVEMGNGDPDEKAGSESDRFLEIWNLVFMAFNRQEDGTLLPLPAKNIDTGSGLERLASVIQGVKTNFDTDAFTPIMKEIERLSGKKYQADPQTDTNFRIIADHIRATVFLITDGVIPGNMGREYVLRRIMRRAIRYGKLLEINDMFMSKLVPVVVELSKKAYPELQEKYDQIIKAINTEEELFTRTLNKGMKILNKEIESMKVSGSKMFNGSVAFELYDTYGFPLELTLEIATENGFDLDQETYNSEMEKQVSRAREAHQATNLNDTAVQMNLKDLPPTQFLGYETLESDAEVLSSKFDPERKELAFIADKTPAYAESGGQVSDRGEVHFGGKKLFMKNVQKVGDYFVHVVESSEEVFKKGDTVSISVVIDTRAETARHHSVTHLLHKALKVVLGETVSQAGSLVNDHMTRFDFSHPAALTRDELNRIEELVNLKIMENLPVETEVLPIEDAKKSGAVAMFGEKYGDTVRILTMGNFSKEFCGGTHVKRTGDIGSFRITGEEAISAGTRRLTGVAGFASYRYAKQEEAVIQSLTSKFKVPTEEILPRVEKLQAGITELEKENSSLKQTMALSQVKDLVSKAKESNGTRFISEAIDIPDMKALKAAADDLLNRLSSGVVVLGSVIEGKANFAAVVSDDIVKKGISAGNIIKAIGPIAGSKGGGKPQTAQAGGGTNPEKLSEALEAVGQSF